MAVEAIGITEVTASFAKAEARVLPTVAVVVQGHAESLKDAWRANARATAGKHGRRYPASITAERRISFGSIAYEVGPEIGKPQGGMGKGFEYGSQNQPPHLDGKRAADAEEPKFLSAAEAAVAGVL
ncbi:MAG: hypothetical protein ACRDLM_12270 [Gaiellaceae bacterium]